MCLDGSSPSRCSAPRRALLRVLKQQKTKRSERPLGDVHGGAVAERAASEGIGLVVATRGAVGPSRTAGRIVVSARARQRRTRRRRGVAGRRCCMKTLRWGGLARISRDPPQEPHYRDEVEGPSHV